MVRLLAPFFALALLASGARADGPALPSPTFGTATASKFLGDGSSLNLTVGGVTKSFPAWWGTLGGAALLNVGPGAGKVAAGDDSRIVGAVQPGGAVDTNTSTGLGLPRTAASRASDVINPRDFGAFGDGASHTVAWTLGINTLAALAAYTVNGKQPYAWANTDPFGVKFNLNPSSGVASGLSTITFKTTATVGAVIPTTAAAASGVSSVAVSDLTMTADGTPVGVGTPASCSTTAGSSAGTAGTASGTTVTAVGGAAGSRTLTLSAATTAAIPSGAYCTFGVTPASGLAVLPVTDTAGIRRGDTVTGAGIPAGTLVESVNPSRLEITLSKRTTAALAAGQALAFVPSWLSRVSAGMQVQGTSFVAGTTVQTVDQVAGTVTLSTPTSGALTAASAITGNTSPVGVSSTITFYRSWTDAEASALEMDGLGIQAAERYLEAAGTGGTVRLPPGKYRTSHPIVFPLTTSAYTTPFISLIGDPNDRDGAEINPVADFGPGGAVLSCGDPTAKYDSARGLFVGTGTYCVGNWANLLIQPLSWSFPGYGLSPTVGGIPVQMDGFKHGPRRDLRDVAVYGFYNGALSVQDHTRWADVYAKQNYNGVRFDQHQANLFGDWVLDRVFATGNANAGISVDANNYIHGVVQKPYLGFNTYGIYLEPGVGPGTGLLNANFINPNTEQNNAGVIVDGGVRDGVNGDGASRTIQASRIEEPYFGGASGSTDAAGHGWKAFFDVYGIYGLTVSNIDAGAFKTVSGSNSLVRVQRVSVSGQDGVGGIALEGEGLLAIIKNNVTQGVQIVSGSGTLASTTFANTGGYAFVSLIGPNWRGTEALVSDSGLSSGLPAGTLLEYGTTVVAGTQATLQRAGLSTARPLAGLAIATNPSNPTGSKVVVIATSWSRLPVLTTATAASGNLLKVSTATPGSADIATASTDAGFAGTALTPIGSTSVYARGGVP